MLSWHLASDWFWPIQAYSASQYLPHSFSITLQCRLQTQGSQGPCTHQFFLSIYPHGFPLLPKFCWIISTLKCPALWLPALQFSLYHQILPRASGSDLPSSCCSSGSDLHPCQACPDFDGFPIPTEGLPMPCDMVHSCWALLTSAALPFVFPLLSWTCQQSTCLSNRPLRFTFPHFVHAGLSASNAFPLLLLLATPICSLRLKSGDHLPLLLPALDPPSSHSCISFSLCTLSIIYSLFVYFSMFITELWALWRHKHLFFT